MLNTGVYIIINRFNGNCYIGSAGAGFDKRWWKHKFDLKKGKHHSFYLQNAYNKYGKNHFEYKILAHCPKEYCLKMEQYFIDSFKPEYNVCKQAGSNLGTKWIRKSPLKGTKRSPEFSEKIRQVNLGKSWTIEMKNQMSQTKRKYNYFIEDVYGVSYTANSLNEFTASKGIQSPMLSRNYKKFLNTGKLIPFKGFYIKDRRPIK